MSKVTWLAGLACMASAVMAEAKDNPVPVEMEGADKAGVQLIQSPPPAGKADLLMDIIKTRLK